MIFFNLILYFLIDLRCFQLQDWFIDIIDVEQVTCIIDSAKFFFM
jgi:hypothetical protein